MKILALSASPNPNGNSAHLVDQLLAAAREAGAQTERVDVNALRIRGCQADYSCKKTGRCFQQDDMQAVYDKIDQADAVVFASPVYMGDVNGQMKTVLDRLFQYLNMDLTSRIQPAKRSVFIASQANPDGSLFLDQLKAFPLVLGRLGFGEPVVLVGPGLGGPDAAAKRPDLADRAREIGRQLARA